MFTSISSKGKEKINHREIREKIKKEEKEEEKKKVVDKYSSADAKLPFEQLAVLLKKCYSEQPGLPLLLDEAKEFNLVDIFIDLKLLASEDEQKKGREVPHRRRELMRENETERQYIMPEHLFHALEIDNSIICGCHDFG